VIRRAYLLVAMALAGASCGAGKDDPPRSCDPLSGEEKPITLQAPLAIGRQADGTLIVVDRRDPEPYVFVSQNGALVRQRVMGSGGGNEGGSQWFQFTLG
jgi:hypothetical protein